MTRDYNALLDSGNAKCFHEGRIFEPRILCSNPPKQRWVCPRCGTEGMETIGGYVDASEQQRQYNEAVERARQRREGAAGRKGGIR